MDLEKEFKKMKAYIYKWHKKDKGDWFPDEQSEGEEKESIDEDIEGILNGERKITYLSLYFKDMSNWKTNQAQYALLYKEDKPRFYKEFAEASEYAYLRFVINQKRFNFEGMGEVGFTFAINALCGWREKYQHIAEGMLYSLNTYEPQKGDHQEAGVNIMNGADYNPAVWFMLDLYCLVYDKRYNKTNADLPKVYTPYDEVLKEWNTTDLKRVDQLVFLLCETHIMRAVKMTDDWEQEFHWNEQQLFPYEIQVWLQMRKEAGLENPKSYTHYLMNEPLGQAFPLEKPLSLPDIPHIELLKVEHPELYEEYVNERKDG